MNCFYLIFIVENNKVHIMSVSDNVYSSSSVPTIQRLSCVFSSTVIMFLQQPLTKGVGDVYCSIVFMVIIYTFFLCCFLLFRRRHTLKYVNLDIALDTLNGSLPFQKTSITVEESYSKKKRKVNVRIYLICFSSFFL